MAWANRKEGDRVGVSSGTNLVILHLPAYEDGTDRLFRNVGI